MVYFYEKHADVKRSLYLFLFFCFGLLVASNAVASNADTLKVIKGKVISALNGEPVPFAHVVNLTRGFGASADNFGVFQIEASDKDSVYISSIGYSHLRMQLLLGERHSEAVASFFLSPVSYEIKAAVVRRWRNYEEFKHDVLALKLPDTKTERLSAYLSTITQQAVYSVPQPMGVGFGEDWYHAQKRKLNEYLVASGRKRMAEERLNPATIMRQVCCTEKNACEFLLWLNADTEYVIGAKDYDLLVYVKEKYEVWCKIFNRC